MDIGAIVYKPAWRAGTEKGGIVITGSLSVVGYGLAVIGSAIGIGIAAYGAAQATARQPEMQSKIFTTFILGAAFAEALALIGFVLALIA